MVDVSVVEKNEAQMEVLESAPSVLIVKTNGPRNAPRTIFVRIAENVRTTKLTAKSVRIKNPRNE
ncbi:MAG: hypothetical protein ACTSUE_07685 [Promethearchaeota archaeon]